MLTWTGPSTTLKIGDGGHCKAKSTLGEQSANRFEIGSPDSRPSEPWAYLYCNEVRVWDCNPQFFESNYNFTVDEGPSSKAQ